MEHYQGNTKYVDACREVGFVNLEWQNNLINDVTGQVQDIAFIESRRFHIYIGITHLSTQMDKLQSSIKNEDYRLRISFDYFTELGKISYSHEYLDSDYERVKEYAQWQATLIYKMLSKLDNNNFDLKPLKPINFEGFLI